MSIPTVTFKATDLPIQSVTVFNDRAQIKRELKTNLPVGTHEIVIENLANTIDGDSIRVDGTGAAQIHEVKFKNEHVVREDIDSPDVQKLVNEKKDLEKEMAHVQDKKDLLKRQLDTLNSMAGKIGSSDKTFVFDESTEENMNKFFSFYDKRAVDLKQEMREADEPIDKLKKQIEKLNNQIDQLRNGANFSRNILVTVNVAEEGDLTFVITYQVYSARWSPSYDIRVVTAESAKDKTVLKMDYFALIEQTTGEEWTDTKILLSTAQPCLGGNVPELGTLNASFYKAPVPEPETYMRKARPMMMSARMYSADIQAAPVMGRVGMTASQQVLSTEFELSEKKTIPSDSSEHKMLITNVAFEPSLLHECVPKKSTNVFLTASVVNNSEFPLIEGDAAVYLNHSFVAKTHLKAVAPGEKFTCSLGVDNAVKVTYKAPQKFNTESGMFSKQATVANTQTITVQNNKTAEPITIIIREHIPKATDEKIKVRLIQPIIEAPKNEEAGRKLSISKASPTNGCILNAEHNLEWTMEIKEGEKKELVIKWQIDYPSTETIEYKEEF
ncbi:hypothetical protein QR680_007152 [Steinernema hermaphroditum]|uniref:Protein F37C4.5 n=1 Tax=Steinernema hermaphroditum TaxID=289476 RepID=A0AA39I0E0_9BILA|nr:hypothetical protein QR680_007152 [Steinernema hermaphroditum]